MKAAPLLVAASPVTLLIDAGDAMVVGTMLQILARFGEIHPSCIEATVRIAEQLVQGARAASIGVGLPAVLA